MSRTITSPHDARCACLAKIGAAFERAASVLVPGGEVPKVEFEPPRNQEYGDYASNVALQLAKRARRAPQVLAGELIERAFADEPALRDVVADAKAQGGFINIRLAPAHWQGMLAEILRAGTEYGRASASGKRISLEFGSANPTGPLVVVQGRTLSLGDSIANAMRFRGADVTTEWIVNDQGTQVDVLARSIHARYRQLVDPAFAFPEDGYPGDDLVAIAELVRARDGDRWDRAPEAEWLPVFAEYALGELVAGQQATCARFRVHFDSWQSEKELHAGGAVEAGIAALRERGLVYDRDGAVWMRTTEFGDDKDRVVVRSDGRPTYYGADIAYHYDKLLRNDRAILILGPDHHGYVARLSAIADAFGKKGAIEVLIAQQMTLVRDGEVVSMSKRSGNVLPLDEILDEVGVDAARFFFVLPNPESPMTFDLTLATEQSEANPVFYVQYGHARIASIERRAPAGELAHAMQGEQLTRLTESAELALARRLAEFPATVQSVADTLAPSKLARYAQAVAGDYHQFYMACRVLTDDADLTVARLGLSRATKLVLASALKLLGVTAPESMERKVAEPETLSDS